jgi:hypothetical protein
MNQGVGGRPAGDRSDPTGVVNEALEQAPSGVEAHDKPSWTITKLAATGTIVLRFVGPTRTWEVPEFLGALSEMMPHENANIIFDLRELDGHNPDTKQPIKLWLIANKSRIANLTLVVARYATIIKVAAAVIGLATGVKLKIRDDLDGETSVRNL